MLTITAQDEPLQGSRQKSRCCTGMCECCERRMRRSSLLPAATKLLSEKSAAGDFFPMN
jgi:hypothetical protein